MKIVQWSIVFIALASGHTTSVWGLREIKFPSWKKCPFLTLGVPPIHQKSPLVFNDVVFTDAVFNDRVFKDALSSVSVFNNVVFNNAVFNSEVFNNEVNDEVLMRFSTLKYSLFSPPLFSPPLFSPQLCRLHCADSQKDVISNVKINVSGS